jgi:hypothetical protein
MSFGLTRELVCGSDNYVDPPLRGIKEWFLENVTGNNSNGLIYCFDVLEIKLPM